MKVGVIPINIGVQAADQVVKTAQLVESLGYESVWTFEHVIVPVDYESKYPYNKSGNMGAAPETTFVDPLIALSAVAASPPTLRPPHILTASKIRLYSTLNGPPPKKTVYFCLETAPTKKSHYFCRDTGSYAQRPLRRGCRG